MLKILTTLLLTLWLSVGAAWADDVEDGDAAYARKDYATALKKYKSLASKNDSHAQFGIGIMYDIGQGVTQDYAEAAHWYRLSAAQGNDGAQYGLGAMYRVGQGVKQDYAEAVRWFKMAAAQGNAAAQSNLASMYFSGQGVVQDYVQAHMWSNLASARSEEYRNKRDAIATKMTQQQVAEAQKIARECQARNFKNCD